MYWRLDNAWIRARKVLQFFHELPTRDAGKMGKLRLMFSFRTTTDSLVRTVLVVEDVDTCATMLEVALDRIPGVDVTCAASGQEALRLLDTFGDRICALVTDLNMPTRLNRPADLNLPCVDGFELIAQVRSDQRYAGLPILVVSGDVDPNTPERVKRLGVDAFFAKPYSPDRVRRTLENLLNGRAAKTS
jgi:CheY-like chemotaxis protein